jgi:hypothetical protein
MVWMKFLMSLSTTRKRCTGFASPAFGSMVLICTHCSTGFSTEQPLGSNMVLLRVKTCSVKEGAMYYLMAP